MMKAAIVQESLVYTAAAHPLLEENSADGTWIEIMKAAIVQESLVYVHSSTPIVGGNYSEDERKLSSRNLKWVYYKVVPFIRDFSR